MKFGHNEYLYKQQAIVVQRITQSILSRTRKTNILGLSNGWNSDTFVKNVYSFFKMYLNLSP